MKFYPSKGPWTRAEGAPTTIVSARGDRVAVVTTPNALGRAGRPSVEQTWEMEDNAKVLAASRTMLDLLVDFTEGSPEVKLQAQVAAIQLLREVRGE